MGPVTPLRIDHDTAEVYAYLLEFLCFCVKQHSFRMRQQLIHSEVFVKIIQLYRCPFTYIKLTVLRFFRTVVGTNDDFYIRQLIKHQVFEPTIRVFLDTDQRNNLLNSAFLELIDYISKAKDISTLLITHLVDNFGHVLDTVTYVPTCQDLRKAYANLNNELGSAHSSPTPDQDADATKDWLKDHEEKSRASEERYFNESDDDDDQYHTALDSFDSDDDEHREASKATEQMEEIVAEPVAETITVPSMEAAEVAASSMSSPPGAFVGPPPPPPLKRKLEDDDDDDDDDVLAAKASSSAAKKTKAVLSPPQDTVQDAADASMDVDGAEEEKDKEPADVDMASDAQEANHVVTIKLSPRLRASPTRLRRTTATTTTKQQQANKENDKNDKPEDDKPKDAPSPRSTRASTRAAAAAAAATQTTTGAISFKLTPPALVSSHQRKTKQMTEKSPDDHEEPKNDN
ncbi:hypothetical protein BC940DRAFT_167287 [Gongronella butleri]|nr:hypothetical protein BC940DRAFT_167287 [Gongronella butleri]